MTTLEQREPTSLVEAFITAQYPIKIVFYDAIEGNQISLLPKNSPFQYLLIMGRKASQIDTIRQLCLRMEKVHPNAILSTTSLDVAHFLNEIQGQLSPRNRKPMNKFAVPASTILHDAVVSKGQPPRLVFIDLGSPGIPGLMQMLHKAAEGSVLSHTDKHLEFLLEIINMSDSIEG